LFFVNRKSNTIFAFRRRLRRQTHIGAAAESASDGIGKPEFDYRLLIFSIGYNMMNRRMCNTLTDCADSKSPALSATLPSAAAASQRIRLVVVVVVIVGIVDDIERRRTCISDIDIDERGRCACRSRELREVLHHVRHARCRENCRFVVFFFFFFEFRFRFRILFRFGVLNLPVILPTNDSIASIV
jgi:hypothetical protein